MKLILTFLFITYGTLTIFSALLAKNIPKILICATFLASSLLILGSFIPAFVPLGLLALLIVAILNGHALYGKPHLSHILLRLAFSLVTLGLWWLS